MMPTTPTWKSTIAKLWCKSQSAAERRLPFALFVCGLLAYGAAYAWHMLTSFDLVNLIRDVNYDDSFYYFQIAYNLAQGKFSTFDGGITQTNGYHPVWMLLITPFYLIFDKETALFGIKAFEIMLIAGGIALIAVAAWLSRLAWLLLFAALPMLYIDPLELLLGLEAAAAMFTLSILILAVCLYMRDPQRWKWPLAALAFALPWVRIEYIAISLAVTAALCAIEWSRQERRALSLSALANIRRSYIPLIGATAGILVYFAYNRLVFGGILPVSAATKQAWSQARIAHEGGYDFIQNFWDTLSRSRVSVFDYELLIAFEICAYLLLVWRLALRSNDRQDWLLVAFLVGMFGLAAGHIAKFAQSVLIMHARHPAAYELWYFVPAYITEALIIPIRLYIAIYLIRHFIARRWSVAANACVVVIGAALLLGTADFAQPFRWVDEKRGQLHIDWKLYSYMGAQFMNRALPEGSVIGSWDASVIGYFSRFPVVNLDGIVNSYDYFRAIRTQQIKEGFNFYRRYGVTHFANTWWYGQLPNNMIFQYAPFDTPHEPTFKLWTYDRAPDTQVEIDYSQQIWDSMQPRFDYYSGGVGVVLAGRTAQAFAKDCPPDETLIWTWNEPKHERTVSLETSPYGYSANLCVDARVLPRNSDRPVHAELSTYVDVDFEDLANREPIIQSDFDVYLIDDDLIYTKSQCSQEDTEARFFASVFPVNPNDLPNRRNDYHTIDFDFRDYGAIDADGVCWAAVDLPNYPIAEIHAGQYAETADGYTHIWVDSYGERSYAADEESDDIDKFEMLADREPIIRSAFDVYIIGDSLIYAKTDCDESDVEPRFYVSIYPLYTQNLTGSIAERGYDAIEFNFGDYGAIADDGQCRTEVSLPNYPIADLHTGQYVETADGYDYLWDDAYRFE